MDLTYRWLGCPGVIDRHVVELGQVVANELETKDGSTNYDGFIGMEVMVSPLVTLANLGPSKYQRLPVA